MNLMQRIFESIKHRSTTAMIVAVLLAFVLGYSLRGCGQPDTQPTETPGSMHDRHGAKASTVWTCSMHPQVRQPGPGQCPICGMDLISLDGEDSGLATSTETDRRLTVSPEAAALMNVQVTPVERRYVEAEVRLAGKVAYDETRLSDITAWVAGRIDRMYVDYTGTTVNQGDHLAEIYSPELLVAQDELLQAKQSLDALGPDAHSSIRRSTMSLLESSREKLRLWGLKDEQIREIEARGTTTDHVTLHAPVGGIVIEKSAKEGVYVKTGSRIYTIADLSRVWIMLDAYESDLVWLRYGQPVQFTTEAYPGDVFEGKIAFIDPVLDDRRRTVSIRVNVMNDDRRLKPGMFIRAVATAKIAAAGIVMAPDLAGKWISPMHPEIVKDKPGPCDICGMPMVKAEDLGYVTPQATGEGEPKPLVIPASAVLMTGKRAVVYVRVPDADKPTFEGREVVLGPRASDYYLVKDGLSEGELVVTRGAFKIDSALQIQAKPSMMNPQGGDQHQDHAHLHGQTGQTTQPAAYDAEHGDHP